MSSVVRSGSAFACIVLAALSLPACGGKKKSGPDGGAGAAGSLPQAPPEPDGIRRYRGMALGRDILPTHAMDPKEATTVWHYRVEWLNNRVIKYERVNPAGGTSETYLIEYKPDGSRLEHARNAYGIELYNDSVDRTNVVTRTWRSGEAIYDGCFWRRRTFDSFGRVETETCLDDKSAVVTDANGCAVVRYQWSVSNDVQSRVCLNNDMSPAYDANGVHRTTYERDLYGLAIDESYYGAQNERVPRLSDGCVRIMTKRDEAGGAIETICADDKGQSTFVKGGGYTTILSKSDGNGCVVEKKYVDFAGKSPKKGNFGSATFTVDKHCGVLVESDKDPRGRPVSFEPGKPPIEERGLAADGLWTRRACKGAGGPVACIDPKRSGAKGSIVVVERDEMGRVIKQKCFQTGDKPSSCEGGYPHERRFDYGPDGRVRAESFFDEKGVAAPGLGAAQVERKYTSVGKVQTESFLDKDGAPVLNKLGFASIAIQYDVQQRVALIQLQGVDGQPKASRTLVYAGISWPSGAAKMSVDREIVGRMANVYLGTDDKLIKRVECLDLTVPCYRR
jgi:hypothetical protein